MSFSIGGDHPKRTLSVSRGRDAATDAVAELVVSSMRDAIAERGRFTWVLAGGSTPEALYTRLAESRFSSRVDFGRVDFFWGDERCVPPDAPQSNYRMAQRALFDAVRPSPERVHRMRGEDDPERASAEYEGVLRAFHAASAAAGESSPTEMPRFDLVLLGMGPDGHTASIFPGSPEALEAKRWVVATRDVHGNARRLTMTLPLLNAARKVAFLVVGADKAERVQEVLGPVEPKTLLPARLVCPTQGELLWFLDAAAAARLETTA